MLPKGHTTLRLATTLRNSFRASLSAPMLRYGDHGTWALIHSAGTIKKAQPFGWAFFIVWWRRGESNPRPRALRHRLYMLIRSIYLTDGYPTGRENYQRFR